MKALTKKLRMIVLDDNEPGPGLLNAWGWSVYLEADEWRLLFDTGPSPHILEYNADRLGVDLRSIDAVFLSHHHGDHAGGLAHAASRKPGVTVYAPPGPIDHIVAAGAMPVVLEKPAPIFGDAWSTGPLSAGRLREHGLAVVVEGLGIVLVVGCSHPGVDRLAEAAAGLLGLPIYMVIGGFHAPPRRVLDRLAGMARIICPAHCSGVDARSYLASRYPGKLCLVRTGSVVEAGTATDIAGHAVTP